MEDLEEVHVKLEDEFNEAAHALQQNTLGLKGSVKLDDRKLLELYGLYKVGTVGPCNESQPGMFNLKGRAKWSAWQHASNLSNKKAQIRYIELVKSWLQWTPPSSCNNQDKQEVPSPRPVLGMGNVVSSFAVPTETEDVEEMNADPVFGWARDNDLVNLSKWLLNASNVNIQDKNGLSPLHWAVDRGHILACKKLLEHGADPRLEDNDGSNCLEYAETCEHNHIVELINLNLNKV